MKDRITKLIVGIVQEMIDGGEIEVKLAIGPDTELYGKSGELDSMGLVSLVLTLEQTIESEFGVNIAMADEKALSQTRSPYRTVNSIAEYAVRQIEEAR